MSDVFVLGAGMVGVSTALALQARGHHVALIDRKDPGRETSYGNGGLIQIESVEPVPFPRNLSALIKIALRQSRDVRFHWAALPSHLGPLWSYYRHSTARRYKEVARIYSRLAIRSIADHRPLIEASNAGNIVNATGLRRLYRSESELEKAAAIAGYLSSEYGVVSRVLDGVQLSAAEPAFKMRFAGSVHFTESLSCSDPGALTDSYARLFVERGGEIMNADVVSLRKDGSGWKINGVSGSARHVVISLGPWSPLVLEPLGYRIPMIRKRGYHRHFTGGGKLNVPVADVERSTFMSPMRQGLRVLTGAELTRWNAPPSPIQMRHCEGVAAEILDLGQPVESVAWVGTRPCMPDMLPVVGPAPRHDGLWFNFGHGHQGFTLGPTTAELLAQELSTGEAMMPELAPSRLGI